MIRLAEKTISKKSASVLVTSDVHRNEETKHFDRAANNKNLTQSMENFKLSGLQEEMCKEHGRKLEIICIQDRMRICANCALFGSHRNHDIRQESDVVNEITLRTEMVI